MMRGISDSGSYSPSARHAVATTCVLLGFAGCVENGGPEVDDPPAVSTVVSTVEQRPTNLVVDSSFESQDTATLGAPWETSAGVSVERDSAFAHHSARNVLIQGTSGWHVVQQWVPVKRFTRYSAAAYIQTSDNLTGGYFSVRGDGSALPILDEVAFGATGGQRSQQRFEFDSGAHDYVLIYVGMWGNGTSAWLRADQLSIVEMPSRIVNGSFEQGTSGWELSPTASLLTSGQRSGSAAVRIRGTSGWNRAQQWVAVQPGRRYRVSGWLRTSANVNDGWFSVRGNPGQTNFDVIDQLHFGAMVGEYQNLSFEFDAGANSSVLFYAGYWAPGADSIVDLDDVTITEAADPNAAIDWTANTCLSTARDYLEVTRFGSLEVYARTLGGNNYQVLGEPLYLSWTVKSPRTEYGQFALPVLVDGLPVTQQVFTPSAATQGSQWVFKGPIVDSTTFTYRTLSITTPCATITRSVVITKVAPTSITPSLQASSTYVNSNALVRLTARWTWNQNVPSTCEQSRLHIVGRQTYDGKIVLDEDYPSTALIKTFDVRPQLTTEYTLTGYCEVAPAVHQQAKVRVDVYGAPPTCPGGGQPRPWVFCQTCPSGISNTPPYVSELIYTACTQDEARQWAKWVSGGCEIDDGFCN